MCLLCLTHPSFLLGQLGTFALVKLPTLWWGALSHPSFVLGQLGTFALVKLPTLWWGTLFIINMKSYLLEVLNRVLAELCL